MRQRVGHRCTECGAEAARWLGRCPECGSWGTVTEVHRPRPRAGAGSAAPDGAGAPPVVALADVDPLGAPRRPSGLAELDRVLGGGLVAGSVTLLGGEPGMGKSTLLLQALGRLAAGGARCLLAGAEESAEQVRLRAGRLGPMPPELLLVADTSLANVLAHAETVRPEVLAIDSIQAVADPELPGVPGSLSQVRECAHRLVRLAKEQSVTVLMVGHVTKDGSLAGPRTLEHVVDTVLSFSGDRHHALRYLHASKHRFGSTQELGLLEMTEAGLVGVPDPSALFLADRCAGAPGSVVTPVLEGARPILVEVQALVTSASAGGAPRRAATGVDGARLALLLAVLQQRARLELAGRDVYVSVAGGIRVVEPGADLAVGLAVAGARLSRPVPAGTVVMGEIGLAGEVRQVPGASRRLAEAVRLGFGRAIVPSATPAVAGVELVRVGSLADAIAAACAPPDAGEPHGSGSGRAGVGVGVGPVGGSRSSTGPTRGRLGLVEVT
jgi:DNA repair protein RadA/Sms